MLFLVLSVACSLAAAMLLKQAGPRLDRAALLAANYAVAFVLAGVLTGRAGVLGGAPALSPALVALGAMTGALFIGGFYAFAAAIRTAGMGLAAGVMRLSVVMPVLAAWALWGERLTPGQGAGLGLAGAAFVLLAQPRPGAEAEQGEAEQGGAGGGRAGPVLLVLFVASGATDVAVKGFAETFSPTASGALFLLLAFGTAFLVGAALVAARGLRSGRWPRGEELGWGALLGVVNYGSADFFLRAAEVLPAPLVFPTNNVAIVLGAAVLGAAVWKERLAPVHLAGLGLAALALALLWGDRA